MKVIAFTFVIVLLSLIPLFAQDDTYCVALDQPGFEQYTLFNQDIEGKKIIMLGEIHYLVANAIIQTKLLMHLNKHFGVRHLLIEFGRAEAYLYNQYLQTGDEWYLRHTFQGFNRYEEFFASWRKLYHYNAGLDSHKKLVVHGLDLEREPGLTASLYKLLSNDQTNPQIKGFRDSLKTRLDTIGVERDVKAYIYALRERIPALSLPDDENKKVIDDILNNNAFMSSLEKRDSLMAEAFLALDTAHELYLGQFGTGHTMLNSKRNLTGRLNSLEHYQDKILVINMYPIDADKSSPFESLSDCPVFLYRFDPVDSKLGGFAKRGSWALVLKDQPSYKRME